MQFACAGERIIKSINVIYLVCCTIVIANCSFGKKQDSQQQTVLERELAGEMVSLDGGSFVEEWHLWVIEECSDDAELCLVSEEKCRACHKDDGSLDEISSLNVSLAEVSLGEVWTRRVAVPAFKLGKHEVTFAQWDACVADGGCDGYIPNDEGWGRGNQPVISVSWDNVQSFIDWLNSKTGGGFRLPTEAEWEYAARAGSGRRYSWGHDIVSNRANCRNDYCGDSWDFTAPVGSFPANAWGLHDMHGNVWEWVQDCGYYSYTGAPKDGGALTIGGCGARVTRGGSWSDDTRYLRSAYRYYHSRTNRHNNLGFRLAREDANDSVRATEYKTPMEIARTMYGEMVFIPAGTFRMGDLSGDGYDDEKPVHSVTVPAFRLGKYEVTVSQFRAFVEATGYRTDAERNADRYAGCFSEQSKGDRDYMTNRSWRDPGYPVEDDQPVACVSRNDAQAFINWLNEKAGGDFRLPSEAEWEYAARAGSTTEYHFGDSESQLCRYANHADSSTYFDWRNESCSNGVGKRAMMVGSYQPNSFGLYDMHGNVWEWTEDCWNDSYDGAPTDGSAWTSGDCSRRVVRGGSWGGPAADLRSANRYGVGRAYRSDLIGVRLAHDE